MKSSRKKALKRLKTLRSIYEKPDAVRKHFGLKRRKLSGSQKFLRMLTR
ncbi:MAG: hypothetical protein RIB03_02950 [Henriciella sp.]|nr:hypothetical protein [Henriciella sp.]